MFPCQKQLKIINSSNLQVRLENKLLQELGDEIDIVISSILSLNSSERSSINWNLVTTLYRNPLLFIIYINIKQALNSWLLQVVTGYQKKLS